MGLLVGCSQYEKLFAKDLRLKCDFVKAHEAKTLLEAKNYKFAIVDLDDPTVDLTRFVSEKGYSAVKLFATSSSNSERIQNECSSLDVSFLPKPLTARNMRLLTH